MPPENVIIVDSSKSLSSSQVVTLFANCGEIVRLIPFILARNCLRDFPGLSHYFVEFERTDATAQATQLRVPMDVKVDLLTDAPALVPIFTSLSNKREEHDNTFRLSQKSKVQDSVAIVRCSREHDQFDVQAIFSTCGKVKDIYDWPSVKSRKQQFFIEFACKKDVENAQTAHFAGFEVLSLAENKRWMSNYKKWAKVGRWALQKELF